MYNTKITQFLQSVVMVPVIMTSLPYQIISYTGAPAAATVLGQVVISQSDDSVATKESKKKVDPLERRKAEEAAKIDAYFASKDMPLEGYGEKMIEESYENGIDPFLLAAISVRESTGGKFACKSVPNSPFGWGSCKIPFDTMDESIETVARNLGGHNPRTARYYAGKTTEQKLKAYNPDHIVPGYSRQVMAIMDTIESHEVEGIQLASR